MITVNFDKKKLRELPTTRQGHCCNCKIDTPHVRVWLCRVDGGVTVEQYDNKDGWVIVGGGCADNDSVRDSKPFNVARLTAETYARKART